VPSVALALPEGTWRISLAGMAARDTLAFFRLWAVLLLATIGLQALEPVIAPLELVSGSAFSAGTAEVALVSARRSEAAEDQLIPTPLLPQPEPVPVPFSAVLVPAVPHLRPDARGPPPRDRAERLPDLRGPPLA
jgi:hypothetical protein